MSSSYLVASPCVRTTTTSRRRHHVSPGRGEESLHELDVRLRHNHGSDDKSASIQNIKSRRGASYQCEENLLTDAKNLYSGLKDIFSA